jgi:aminopeptidase N
MLLLLYVHFYLLTNKSNEKIYLCTTGYYRVKYDVRNWRLIADYLNFKTYKEIHVLNRAQLIDDAYHFMMKKQLDYEIFLNLTNYLSRETDYVAWYPMIKIFEYLSGFLPFQSSYPLKVNS